MPPTSARVLALSDAKPRPATAPHGHTALGSLLVERGLITDAQLARAIEQQKDTGPGPEQP